MSITDKTRKILWGRSGNRCSFCKCRLVVDASELDEESVIGEECHIISGAMSGPRHDQSFDKNKIDDLENLILLCRIHHKLIDDQEETFSSDILRALKKNHEKWVNHQLDKVDEMNPIRLVRKKAASPECLLRVLSGKILTDHIAGAAGSFQDYPGDLSEEELDLIGVFFQEINDWIDFGINDPRDRIECQKSMDSHIHELSSSRLRIYIADEILMTEGGVLPPSEWRAVHVRIVRSDDPTQIEASDS